MKPDPDTCEHIWLLDKESTVVRLRCLLCGAVKDYAAEPKPVETEKK